MTIDKAKLKALAQAVADLENIPEREDEHAEAVDALWLNMHCHTILALLAEIERLREDPHMRAIRSLRSDCADLMVERDQLRDENEALKSELRKEKSNG